MARVRASACVCAAPARMFGRPFPDGTAPEIAADFGVDLLTVDDAEARLRDQAREVEQLFAAVQSAGVQ